MADHDGRFLRLGTLALLLFVCPVPGRGAMKFTAITGPVSAVYSPQAGHTAIQLWGDGFGVPAAGTGVVLRSRGETVTIPSTDPRVFLWHDDRIVLDLPLRVTKGRIRVRTPFHASRFSPIRDAYEYEWFALAPDGAPLELALDGFGRIWVNSEFHVGFQMFDTRTHRVAGLSVPARPGPLPFATTVFGDHASRSSDGGEDVIVDPEGRVWFTEGGALNYHGAYPNHSRIVRYDPAPGLPGDRYRVYDIPGDNNEVVGIAYDAARHRIWFTENATATNERGEPQPAKLVSFDPDRIPADDRVDFPEGLDHLRCRQGASDDACYHDYPLPTGTYMLAHVTIDRAGFVWYAQFIGAGNRIGRLDPTTGSVVTYPLPRSIGTSLGARYLGSGPCEMRTADNGDIVIQEFNDCQVTRFDYARVDDPPCLALDADGNNPCMESLVIPDADLARQFAAGINFDGRGRLWLGLGSGTADGSATNAIGYVRADWTSIVMLPPLSVFPGPETFSLSGVVPNRRGDVVWFGEYQRNRIGQLRKLG